ncbi:MAG: phosphotransferase [Rhodocyclaceae bacterium]|nr:phosphotransferase [Rhodocyclaceae bacterium]MBX3668871.1 phosphotransferase [Rhodocyclaceae bacterium]
MHTTPTTIVDPRKDAIAAWLADLFPGATAELTAASEDASFRRYLRARFPDETCFVVMDAPPERENCRAWLAVQQLFEAAGAHVPKVHAADVERGFLLLSDLGNTTYLNALEEGNASALYLAAIDTLIRIQGASRPGVLPEYDRERLLVEMELFPVWYMGRHLGRAPQGAEADTLYEMFERLLTVNLAEPRVFVHRDYHSRNLMVTGQAPGVLDFQDALYGPITYDLASLFKDAYIAWDEERTLDWLIRYWERARTAGLPVRADFAEFHRDYEWMGAQRHLKVLGIFARLYHRDGKDGYLKDLPLVFEYLRKTATRYRELHPLAKLLDRLDPRETRVGYTF